MTIHDVDTLILFDPMTHSQQSYVFLNLKFQCDQCHLMSRDSGIGDHGPDGIKAFTLQHDCNHICHALQLASLSEEGSDGEQTKGEK